MTLASSTVLPVPAPACRRRGVLLLICLSMLTLFMLLGTTYMVVTSRARDTARAFARTSGQQFHAGGGDGHRVLDAAVLTVIRGQLPRIDATTNKLAVTAVPAGDDLLGDRYGLTVSAGGAAATEEFEEFEPIRGPIIGRIATTDANGNGLGSALARIEVGFEQTVPASLRHPAALTGRVFTAIFPDLTWTTRILRAEGTTTTTAVLVSLDPGLGERRATVAKLEQSRAKNPAQAKFLINGREFTPPLESTGDGVDPLATNEPYDGFDEKNPFLAKLVPVTDSGPAFSGPSAEVGTSKCEKASFQGTRPPSDIQVDNDADGVNDSIWLDIGLPVQRDGSGGFCKPRAAVLVVDLDGRLNANLHGRLEEAELLAGVDWPQGAENIPAGSGYGPPEIRLGDLMRTDAKEAPSAVASDLTSVLTGPPAPSGSPPAPSPGEKRARPVLAKAQGRYGQSGRPGASGDDALSKVRDERRGQPAAGQQAGRPPNMTRDWLTTVARDADAFGSPSDLKGVMKVFAADQPAPNSVVATLRYAKPQLAKGPNVRPWMTDCDDDPYELRPGQATADDGLFNPDEVERILRAYDWDVSQLPPRLAAVLGRHAERLRLLLTTEQWDTTAIVGDAWTAIERGISSFEANVLADGAKLPDILAPEVIGGRRMDLNRPVMSQPEADRFCRGLYTLLWFLADDALAGDDGRAGQAAAVAPAIAQWAVNVLDFRDADSVMTRFAYDRNPLDGWNPAANDVVWGVERPEIVITEAVAWQAKAGQDGGLYVMLHRPWHTENFEAKDELPSTNRRSDRVDPVLDTDPAKPTNELNLAARGGGDDKSPVWRLKAGNAVVRFDNPNPTAAGPNDHWSTQAATRSLPTNGWACVFGSSGTPAGGPVTIENKPAILQFQVDRPAPIKPPANQTETTVVLERLADPSQPHDADANPYLAIDSMTVAVADRNEKPQSQEPRQNYAKQSRKAGLEFWAQPPKVPPPELGEAGDTVEVGVLAPGNIPAPWFPFLNRPFVSNAELAIISWKKSDELLDEWKPPQGNGMLADLAEKLGVTDAAAQRHLIGNLLAATIVPSRFAGISGTAEPGASPFAQGSPTGLDQLPDAQYDRYREPGRVNLNTVTDQRIWDATVLRGSPAIYPDWPDDLKWKDSMLGGRLDVKTASAAPAETTLDLLGLREAAAVIVNDTDKPGPDPALNPQFRYLTANRLANVATNRSHVFAIWVTVGFFECDERGAFLPNANTPRELGADTGQIRRHRAFYIVDRSIPVAYETGRDHNVRDTIRLRRVIQ